MADHGQEEHGHDIPSPSASWDSRKSSPRESSPRTDPGQDPITKFFPLASESGHDAARLLAAALAAAGGAKPKKKRFRDSRSKYEMTDDLKKRGIRVPKSSTKEDLSRMLQQADQLCAGSRDMGSVVNVGGPLAIAIANEEFWKSLGSWRYLGLLSRLCTAYKSVQCNEAAWRTVLKCQAGGLLRKKSVKEVLAVPKDKIQQVSGRENVVSNWYGEVKKPMTEFHGTSALEVALKVHGTMENIAIARIKKAKSNEKIAAAKSSKERRLQQGMVFPPIGSGFEAHPPAPTVPVPHTGHVGVHHATVIEVQNVFP